MPVKSKLKQTAIGTLPEDWDVVELVSISDKIMVGIASAATHAYRSKGVPMFRNQNIHAGQLDDSELLFISPDYESTFRNKRLQGGDLLTARTGYPGVTAVVPAKYAKSQSFTTLITRPKQGKATSEFLCHYINSESGQRFFTQSQIGGAQKNVNVATLRLMPIPLPRQEEQRAIAGALSDVDALLGVLDRMITKKRDLKLAAMQQLLTGQTRLPGFKGDWEEKTLGQLGVFHKGSGIKRDELIPDGIPCVRYGEIYTVHDDIVRKFHSFIPREIANESQRLERGDLLFTGSGETREEIGKCAAYVFDQEAYAGGDIVILRTNNKSCATYLGYLLNHSTIAEKKARLGQGDTVVHISARNLSKIALILPAVTEQTAIAEVLSDMDAELSALARRREKTQALKQGMMQELLTGKTRLVTPAN